MTSDRDFDDATLHAYVDGELDAERAAAVADWLLHHPREARQVLDWREQRDGLQALREEWLDEPVPDHLVASLQASRTGRSFWPQAWAAAMLLAVGLGAGWSGHAWWHGRHGYPERVATTDTVPAFVRDAAIAHVVYQPEKRHPVEVAADQQDHLVQWLSRRLGQPLKLPDLSDQGLRLVGGRLLPAGQPANGTLARAQFMYEDDAGKRLTLYVSTGASSPDVAVAFKLTKQIENGQETRSLYWIEGPLGYAINGPFDDARLRELAHKVHERLQ